MPLNNKQISEICENAWIIWGIRPQMTQFIEEMAELIVELNKKYMREKDNEEALIEEMGDVKSMILQAEHIMRRTIPNYDEKLQESMEKKWHRTVGRINKAAQYEDFRDVGSIKWKEYKGK